MTATTTDVRTRNHEQLSDRPHPAWQAARALAAAVRDGASSVNARWRAAIVAGQLGPDAETIIGRGSGARI